MSRTNRHPTALLAEATADRYRDMATNGWREFTGSIALDSFLATKGEERARVWQAASASDRRGLVMQALRAKGADFDNALIEAHIAKYNARYGAALPATDAAVIAALEELEGAARQSERAARAAGERDDARHFSREANAAARALEAYVLEGIRPVALNARAYILPSRSGDVPHLLRFDGIWRCNCKSADSAHWASALLLGIEMAAEIMERDDVPFVPNEQEAQEEAPTAPKTGGDCALHGPFAGERCHRCEVIALSRRISRARAAVWASV